MFWLLSKCVYRLWQQTKQIGSEVNKRTLFIQLLFSFQETHTHTHTLLRALLNCYFHQCWSDGNTVNTVSAASLAFVRTVQLSKITFIDFHLSAVEERSKVTHMWGSIFVVGAVPVARYNQEDVYRRYLQRNRKLNFTVVCGLLCLINVRNHKLEHEWRSGAQEYDSVSTQWYLKDSDVVFLKSRFSKG